MRLRVLVYNVHGFRAGVDRVAELVRDLEPDLLLLNETGGRRRLRRFASALGLQVARDPRSPFRRRVKDAVLLRPPWVLGDHRLIRFAGSRRLLPRGATVARVGRPPYRFTAIVTHLGLRPGERILHARELAGLIRTAEPPVLLGGDLNEPPEGRAFGILADRLRDAWVLRGEGAGETFPAAEPMARIDALFVSEGVRVERVWIPADAQVRSASDHRPVVAELALPEPG